MIHTIIFIRVTASYHITGNNNEVHAMRPVRMNILPDHAVQWQCAHDQQDQVESMTTDGVVILQPI